MNAITAIQPAVLRTLAVPAPDIEPADVTAEPEAVADCLRALRSDLQLLEHKPEDGGSAEWKLYDPLRNQFFKIGWLEFECLRRWKLGRAEAVLNAVRKETPLRISPAQIQQLQDFLQQRELLQARSAADVNLLESQARKPKKQWWMRGFLFTLYHRIPLMRPDPALAVLHRVLRPLFSKATAVVFALLFSFAVVGVGAHWYEFTDQFANYMTPSGFLAFGLVLLFINMLHEFGHGVAAHHFSCKVPRMGIALIFMMPMFYSDTSDSWRLSSRTQRMWIGAAGMLSETVLAVFATLAWLILPDGLLKTLAYFMAVSSWAMTLLVNLNPFMKFDGYFLLSDALGVENLQDRGFTNLRWQLRKSLLGAKQAMPNKVTRAKHRILCTYAMGTWVYRLFLYIGIAWMVYSFWFKALGIVMMAGVVIFMLGKPVIKELGEYRELIARGGVSNRRWVSFGCAVTLILLCLLPLPRKIVAPAVLSTVDSAQLFAPQAALVEELIITAGQSVSSGDLLIKLRDPELEFQQASLLREIKAIRSRLAQESAWQHSDGFRQMSGENLASKQAELESVLQSIEMLSMRAPFDGRVESIPDWLQAGTWVPANDVMAEISGPAQVEVRAYIEAQEKGRLLTEPAWFYDNNGKAIAKLETKTISSSTIPMLDDALLAVAQGGVIPAEQDERGALVPMEDWYLSTLAPIGEVDVRREQTGYLLLPASSSSLLWRGIQRVYAALIRESGF